MPTSPAPGREGHHNASPNRRHVLAAMHLGHQNPIADVLHHETPTGNTNKLQHVSTY